MTALPLLADLLSYDPQRVWAGACAVINETDAAALTELASHLPQIGKHTAGLDLGGALFPNSEHLQQALRVLQAVLDGECRCQLYPTYQRYNPETEQALGRVRILGTSPPDWEMTYQAECLVCQARFDVEQAEYHYTWWQWTFTSGTFLV